MRENHKLYLATKSSEWGKEIKLSQSTQFPARQMTMAGIEIKREGTQCPFHLTSRASSFALQQRLPTPHLGFSPGTQEAFQASQKSSQNGFRNRTNLLQVEKSGFVFYLREKREPQEARLETHGKEHQQETKLATLNTQEHICASFIQPALVKLLPTRHWEFLGCKNE